MKQTALAFLSFLLPVITFAQVGPPAGSQPALNNSNTLNELFAAVISFINSIAVPLIFALAFVFFLYGVFKYFFGSGSNAEKNRTEGKQFIMYGVIGFFVMISLWGLVNIAVRTFGFEDDTMPPLPTFGPSSGSRAPAGTP